MDQLAALLEAIHDDPADGTAWLVLADWLEEQGEAPRAELTRLRVTLCDHRDSPARRQAERRQRELLAGGVRPCAPTRTFDLGGGVEIALALAAPGTFWMGSPEGEPERYSDEGPLREVTLTRPFYLGVTPVTQAQWRALMVTHAGHFRGDDHPVEKVTWDQARAFCTRLAGLAGRPCRLPSEAEWEYACRAGTTSAYCSGDAVTDLDRAGWYECQGTQPVGRKEPNAWGLFDMHGNVMEWCLDWYDSGAYRDRSAVDPPGPQRSGSRVLRGGAWCYTAKRSRSAYRSWNTPGQGSNHIGFRVLMEARI